MLDDKDINKLKSVFATKEDFGSLASKGDLAELRKEFKEELGGLKEDLKSDIKNVQDDLDSKFLVLKTGIQDVKKDVEGLREAIQNMMVSVDNLAKVISDLRLEYVAITHQINRHEAWIKQIAEKLGLKLAAE